MLIRRDTFLGLSHTVLTAQQRLVTGGLHRGIVRHFTLEEGHTAKWHAVGDPFAHGHYRKTRIVARTNDTIAFTYRTVDTFDGSPPLAFNQSTDDIAVRTAIGN